MTTPVPDDDDDSLPTRELHRLAGGSCFGCRQGYTAREAVFSIALGFKAAPRCLPCLATGLGRLEDELREQLLHYIDGRECYRKAWRVAEQMDGVEPVLASGGRQPPVEPEEKGGLRPPLADTEWDAGDMGCGELVMALRLRMNALPPGAVLRVIATDPAAPEDLPAWCRMTGHPLLLADHPRYLIQRKGA